MHFCHDGARVHGRYLKPGSGLREHKFTGVMTPASTVALVAKCLPFSGYSDGVIVRTDTAVKVYAEPLPFDASTQAVLATLPPHAHIVSEADYAHERAAAEAMLKFGMFVTVWLPHQLEMAQNWVEKYAALRRLQSPGPGSLSRLHGQLATALQQ
jgi:hypothetical protein